MQLLPKGWPKYLAQQLLSHSLPMYQAIMNINILIEWTAYFRVLYSLVQSLCLPDFPMVHSRASCACGTANREASQSFRACGTLQQRMAGGAGKGMQAASDQTAHGIWHEQPSLLGLPAAASVLQDLEAPLLGLVGPSGQGWSIAGCHQTTWISRQPPASQ